MRKIYLLIITALIAGGTAQAAYTTSSFTQAAALQSNSEWKDGSSSIALKDAVETGTGLRHGLLRLDLSGITNTVTDASIKINAKKLISYTLYLWGVVDDAPGQDWNSTSTTMADVATSGMYSPIENLESAGDTNLMLLGSQVVIGTGLSQYDDYFFSSSELVDWLNSDADGDATVVVTIGEGVNTAVRSITTDDAPELTFSIDPADAPSPVKGFQIGGDDSERDTGWSSATVNAGGTTATYTHVDESDSSLVFTLTASVTNAQDQLYLSTGFLGVDSSARGLDEAENLAQIRRLSPGEEVAITLTVSDPNNALATLGMSGVGPMWGTGPSETTTVTDVSSTSFDFVAIPNDTLIQGNWSSLGLNELSVVNAASWAIIWTAQPGAQTGVGGFAFQYTLGSVVGTNSAGIAPNHTNLVIRGSLYNTSDAAGVSFQRISDATMADPDRAFTASKSLTTPGISIWFKTDSDTISVNFTQNTNNAYRGGRFGIHEDGVYKGNTGYFKPTATNMSFTVDSASPSSSSVYCITLPTWSKPDFRGLELDEGATLFPYTPPEQKTYVAMGDSITHGRGQATTSEIYPFLVAEELGLKLYNVAVGGSKVSVPIAEMLADYPAIDVITVLIGYNDLHGDKTAEEYADDMDNMLTALRVSQPDVQVICISPTYTTNPTNETTGVTLQEFRQVVYDEVAARRAAGDDKIHLVRGEEITTEADLDDAVHLSVAGAARFASLLAPLMEPMIEGDVALDDASYPLYPQVANLLTNTTPYDLTQETYQFGELWRIPKSSYTNMLDYMGRTPIVSRGTNTFIVSVDQDYRPVVTRIDATGTESAFIDNTLYQPDEFYANTDADPDNDVVAAKFYTAKPDDPHHNFSIGIDPQGYLHIVGDMHNYPQYNTPMAHLPLRYFDNVINYWRSDNPYDISSFTYYGDQATKCPQGYGFTYYTFFNDWNGELLMGSRAMQASLKRGIAVSRYDEQTGNWSVVGGTVPGEPNHPRLFYEDAGVVSYNGLYSKTSLAGLFDRNNNMHCSAPMVGYDIAYPEIAGALYSFHHTTHILYARSDDGGSSFLKADGVSPIAMPARVAAGTNQADFVYVAAQDSPTTCSEYINTRVSLATDYREVPFVEMQEKFTNDTSDVTYIMEWDSASTSWAKHPNPSSNGGGDFILQAGPEGVLNWFNDDATQMHRFWHPTNTAVQIDLPWSFKNIDAEYVKQTGNILGVAATSGSSGDIVIARVDISRPGLALVVQAAETVTNHPPVITAPCSINGTILTVTATDADGDPLTYTWSMAYGPADVSFVANGTEASSNTVASFTQSGTYELKVAVSDGIETRISTCSFHHVIGDPNVPRITVEADAMPASLIIGETSTLTVSAANEPAGGIAQYLWSQSSGPGSVSFSANGTASSSNTVASFDAIGTYELHVIVSNSAGTVSSSCTVAVNAVPPASADGYLAIDFSSQAFESFVSADDNFDRTGTVDVVESGAGVRFTGDLWKAFPIDYPMTPDTVIEFDFSCPKEGELHAIAMTDTASWDFTGSHYELVKLHGTVNGIYIMDRDGEYTGGTNRYSIAIGQLLTLNAEQKNYLDFVTADNKNEVIPDAQSTIANVIIYEPNGDKDGDGQSNLVEIRLGSDPEDPASMFGINGGTILPYLGKVSISWPSQAGVRYRIQQSPDLSAWTVVRDWSVAQTPPKDGYEADLSPSNGYFKVEAQF